MNCICRAESRADARQREVSELQKRLDTSQAEVWMAMLESETNAEKFTQAEIALASAREEVLVPFTKSPTCQLPFSICIVLRLAF